VEDHQETRGAHAAPVFPVSVVANRGA
jgi:hypothetical protein